MCYILIASLLLLMPFRGTDVRLSWERLRSAGRECISMQRQHPVLFLHFAVFRKENQKPFISVCGMLSKTEQKIHSRWECWQQVLLLYHTVVLFCILTLRKKEKLLFNIKRPESKNGCDIWVLFGFIYLIRWKNNVNFNVNVHKHLKKKKVYRIWALVLNLWCFDYYFKFQCNMVINIF